MKIDQEEEVKEVALTEAVEEASEVETKEVAEEAQEDTTIMMIHHQLEMKRDKITEAVIDMEVKEDIMITMITEETIEVVMTKDPHVAEMVQDP